MIIPTLEELLHVAERTLGAPPVIRDAGMLQAALARPSTTVFGQDAYPSDVDKAAALVHSLVRNHALLDGNKRLGLAGSIVVLGMNGYRLRWSNDEAYDFIIEIAEGRLTDVPEIATWIAAGVR